MRRGPAAHGQAPAAYSRPARRPSPRIAISVVAAARTVAKERNPLSLSEGVWPIVPGPSAASRLSRFMSVSTALRAPEDAHLQIAARTAGPTSAADRHRSSHSSILACELLRRHS